ncbi:toprim domain-containing protein [Planctomycetes bacterium K23_9]|uniref:DNA topoisomerase (ATP-hydrolyzing) n=1 Tax=Stieleria marina TaxID=1930275 RepID=A0A517NRM6_9BACT|nr:DNA gyrase subunit B [Planctomycetes bacterium K23_9]
MNFYPKPAKLHECFLAGPGNDAELFLVEGDSASKSVARARDSKNQAVLPMQGKPMNAAKASKNSVAKNNLYQNLIACLGAGWDDTFDLDAVRYQRVILLFDPDADGIHCGALMLMFFYRWMRPLLEADRLSVVRPPLYQITSADYRDTIYAYSGDHFKQVQTALKAKNIIYQSQRYRGLASMGEQTLLQTCLEPDSRHIYPLGRKDAEAAIAAFGGKLR